MLRTTIKMAVAAAAALLLCLFVLPSTAQAQYGGGYYRPYYSGYSTPCYSGYSAPYYRPYYSGYSTPYYGTYYQPYSSYSSNYCKPSTVVVEKPAATDPLADLIRQAQAKRALKELLADDEDDGNAALLKALMSTKKKAAPGNVPALTPEEWAIILKLRQQADK